MSLTLLLLSSVACQDSFLDLKPYDSLSADAAFKTEADLQVAVNGMYAGLRNVDLFGRTIPVIGDLLADNAYVSPSISGRYLTTQNYGYNAQNADADGSVHYKGEKN